MPRTSRVAPSTPTSRTIELAIGFGRKLLEVVLERRALGADEIRIVVIAIAVPRDAPGLKALRGRIRIGTHDAQHVVHEPGVACDDLELEPPDARD